MNRIIFAATVWLLTIGANSTFAQNIPNNGFENWVPAGPFESPEGWAGTMGLTKSQEAHSGDFAMQLQAGAFMNPMTGRVDTMPGVGNTGSQGMGPGMGVRGFAFTGRPDSLVGYYKYTASGNDMPIFRVVLTKWNAATNMSDMISNTLFMGTSQSAYTRFAFPIDYISQMTPDSANIELISSGTPPNQPLILGSVLLVDDLDFIYTVLAVKDAQPESNSTFSIFPNPVQSQVFVKMENTDTENFSLKIMDASGRVEWSQPQVSGGVDVSFLKPGMYFVQVTDFKNKAVSTQKFVKL